MIKLGPLVLGKKPTVAVVFKDGISHSVIQKIKRSAPGSVIAELRIDCYASFDKKYVLKEVNRFKALPTIATIRCQKEGGRWTGSEKDRLSLFKAVLPRVDAVDIELGSRVILKPVLAATRKAGKTCIVSHHDFKKTPGISELNRITRRAKLSGADIVKIATLAAKPGDLRVLADFILANPGKHLIVIAMGPQGKLSRILFPGLGSLITYAHLGKPSAPGQLNYKTTLDLLKKFYPVD